MVLKRGSRGQEVNAWQAFLRSQGYTSIVVDGDFGPATEDATRAWQRSRGLGADGVVGPETQRAAGLVAAPSSSAPSSSAPSSSASSASKSVAKVRGIERLTVAELAELDAAAKAIGIPVDWLAAVISFETGGKFSTSVKNAAGSGATGLIQFMPDTAKELLKTPTREEAIRQTERMSFGEQLRRMVVPYFGWYRGRLRSLNDVYLAVFYPAFIDRRDDDIVAEKDGRNAAVYRQNAVFDKQKRGYITKADITSTIRSVLDAAVGRIGLDGDVIVATAKDVGKASAVALPLVALGVGALVFLSKRR
jgi:peptidoglycan hydrolase-like protein with peptidoglycan-binding domain